MKTRELMHLQELNLDLLDANRNLASYLVDLYERRQISHEDFQRVKILYGEASKALARLNETGTKSTENLQR